MKSIKQIIYRACYLVVRLSDSLRKKILDGYYKSILDIDPSARIGNCLFDKKNISIGANTYMQSGTIYSGNACVVIGKNCAIGSNVSIKARTHDPRDPTSQDSQRVNKRVEKDIMIGDSVWIGDNVFIREGVSIGSNCIIGANSVVTKDVPPHSIAAGCPARIIRENHNAVSNS